MKGKKIKNLIYILFLLSFIAYCSLKEENVLYKINLSVWNQQTLKTLINECHIESINYDNSKNSPKGLKYEGKIFSNIEDHILYLLQQRKCFLRILKKSKLQLDEKELGVIELYQQNESIFIVNDKDSNFYSININAKKPEGFFIKKTDTYKDWFNDTIKCVNEMEVILEGMWITTIIKNENDSVSYDIKSITLF